MVLDGLDFIRSAGSFIVKGRIFKERRSTFEDASELVAGRHSIEKEKEKGKRKVGYADFIWNSAFIAGWCLAFKKIVGSNRAGGGID